MLTDVITPGTEPNYKLQTIILRDGQSENQPSLSRKTNVKYYGDGNYRSTSNHPNILLQASSVISVPEIFVHEAIVRELCRQNHLKTHLGHLYRLTRDAMRIETR